MRPAMIFNWNQRKRRHKRYDVSWDALLEIESVNFHDYIFVPIINLSQSGALVYSDWISIHNYHLAVAGQNNELNLVIHTPGIELDSKVAIKRYNWADDVNGFELGIEFKNMCRKNQDQISEIIKNARYYRRMDQTGSH